MIAFHWKESLDIATIKEPKHFNCSEINFYDNFGRGISLLSVLFVLAYAILLVRFRRSIGAFEASLLPMLIGLICALLTIPIHELLHAMCVSKNSDVHIYRVKAGFMTWFSNPITKERYLVMLLAPVLSLGILPSICTFLIPETAPNLISFLLIFSLGNIGMAYGDLTNFIVAAIKVKHGNKVVPCKNGICQIQ